MSQTDTFITGAQDASASGTGNQTIRSGGANNDNRIDQSVDNSVDQKLSGNIGATSGDGNTILGTGAQVNNTTVENLGADVVARALDSADRAAAASYGLGGKALETVAGGFDNALDFASAATAGSLEAANSANSRAFSFGSRALDSTDAAYAGGFGFGKDALEVVAGFGSSTIQNANARADSALAAVERLAAVPTERNGSSAQDSRVTLFVLGGLALLALLLGRSRPAKS